MVATVHAKLDQILTGIEDVKLVLSTKSPEPTGALQFAQALLADLETELASAKRSEDAYMTAIFQHEGHGYVKGLEVSIARLKSLTGGVL